MLGNSFLKTSPKRIWFSSKAHATEIPCPLRGPSAGTMSPFGDELLRNGVDVAVFGESSRRTGRWLSSKARAFDMVHCDLRPQCAHGAASTRGGSIDDSSHGDASQCRRSVCVRRVIPRGDATRSRRTGRWQLGAASTRGGLMPPRLVRPPRLAMQPRLASPTPTLPISEGRNGEGESEPTSPTSRKTSPPTPLPETGEGSMSSSLRRLVSATHVVYQPRAALSTTRPTGMLRNVVEATDGGLMPPRLVRPPRLGRLPARNAASIRNFAKTTRVD